MKKSTKVLIILFLIFTIPALIIGREIFAGIKPVEDGFTFNFSVKGIVALVLSGLSGIFGNILYFRFLFSLSVDRLLFFASFPLFLIYGVLIFLLAQLSYMKTEFALTMQNLLNISPTNAYNTILWATLVTIIFILLLLLNYVIICRPLTNVERIVLRLGDGTIKEDRLFVGGGKQFSAIEHGLNKINSNYKARENSLKDIDLSSKNVMPKQFFKFLGKSNVEKLERGENVKQSAIILNAKLISLNDSQTLSLEENYNLVNSYLNIISPIIRKNGGFIDSYSGDGIIGVFSKSIDAINCAHVMSKTIEAKNSSKRNMPNISERIVITFMDITFGLAGENEQKYPRIISPIFEDIERLDEVCKFIGGRILYTKSCVERLPLDSRTEYRYVGFVSLSAGQMVLYEDLSVKPKKDISSYLKTKRYFEKGVICYNQGRFDEAKKIFEEILRILPQDKASFIYFGKSQEKIK